MDAHPDDPVLGRGIVVWSRGWRAFFCLAVSKSGDGRETGAAGMATAGRPDGPSRHRVARRPPRRRRIVPRASKASGNASRAAGRHGSNHRSPFLAPRPTEGGTTAPAFRERFVYIYHIADSGRARRTCLGSAGVHPRAPNSPPKSGASPGFGVSRGNEVRPKGERIKTPSRRDQCPTAQLAMRDAIWECDPTPTAAGAGRTGRCG